jgi:hypothetical protein
MGSDYFIEYVEGVDIGAAFRAAVEEAQSECGHGGFTGSIAEKDSCGYVAITTELMTIANATRLANKTLYEGDPEILHPDMPACAIPIRGGERRFAAVQVPAREDGYPDKQAAALEAVTARLGAGEVVTEARLWRYDVCDDGRIVAGPHCTASVTTTGSLEQTGWMFFGWARN